MVKQEKKHSHNFKDLSGKKFGRLTVISLEKNEKGKIYWKCLCECGNIKTVSRNCLMSGNTKSCGCLHSDVAKRKNYKHGKTNTRIYKIWAGMKKRCNNPHDSNYDTYGGRGISVCEEWNLDFINFYNWTLNNGYNDNLTIDRINVNGNYEASNCRWITQAEQTRNVRSNVKITINGKTKLLSQWSKETGIDRRTISKRIKLGWKNNELLSPIDNTHRQKRRKRECFM